MIKVALWGQSLSFCVHQLALLSFLISLRISHSPPRVPQALWYVKIHPKYCSMIAVKRSTAVSLRSTYSLLGSSGLFVFQALALDWSELASKGIFARCKLGIGLPKTQSSHWVLETLHWSLNWLRMFRRPQNSSSSLWVLSPWGRTPPRVAVFGPQIAWPTQESASLCSRRERAFLGAQAAFDWNAAQGFR